MTANTAPTNAKIQKLQKKKKCFIASEKATTNTIVAQKEDV